MPAQRERNRTSIPFIETVWSNDFQNAATNKQTLPGIPETHVTGSTFPYRMSIPNFFSMVHAIPRDGGVALGSARLAIDK
jgi:hypothetical protein